MGWASYAEDVDDRLNENRHAHESRSATSASPGTVGPAARRRRTRRGPRSRFTLSSFFRPATSRADLVNTIAELQNTISDQQRRLTALENDNRNLIRMMQRLRTEKQALVAELARSRQGREPQKGKNPKKQQTRVWRNDTARSRKSM